MWTDFIIIGNWFPAGILNKIKQSEKVSSIQKDFKIKNCFKANSDKELQNDEVV